MLRKRHPPFLCIWVLDDVGIGWLFGVFYLGLGQWFINTWLMAVTVWCKGVIPPVSCDENDWLIG